MKKAKTKTPKSVWSACKPYPEAQRTRSGCKVSWRIYASEADAKVASEAAKHNAVIQEQRGYDFGYCNPGLITPVKDGFEVCIP